MELIVISPEGDFPAETAWVNRLFSAGLQTLHLRKPGWNENRLLQYLAEVEEPYHRQIMLHGGPAIGAQMGLKGIHFPLAALPAVKPGYRLSCSVHSWPELQEVSPIVDYAFISPFFDSISKKGYKANPGLSVIPRHAERKKAVALGGIHGANILEVQQMGLKGAAVLGAIWQTADPLLSFKKLRAQAGW